MQRNLAGMPTRRGCQVQQNDHSNDGIASGQRMTRAAALRKIKARAGIAKSSDPHEAGRALQEMQALMIEFKIDDPELVDVAFSDTPRARGGRARDPGCSF